MVRTIFAVLITIAPALAGAQTTDATISAIEIAREYQITPNLTYLTANNYEAKLDVYRRREMTTPNRTLIYIHGGGWTGGAKEQSSLTFLPFFRWAGTS
jgi:acetyl esterase/lipase